MQGAPDRSMSAASATKALLFGPLPPGDTAIEPPTPASISPSPILLAPRSFEVFSLASLFHRPRMPTNQ